MAMLNNQRVAVLSEFPKDPKGVLEAFCRDEFGDFETYCIEWMDSFVITSAQDSSSHDEMC